MKKKKKKKEQPEKKMERKHCSTDLTDLIFAYVTFGGFSQFMLGHILSKIC